MGNKLNEKLKPKQLFLQRASIEEVEEAIDNLCDREEKQLLRLKYIEKRIFVYISLRMNVSRATAYRIHARALEHLVIPNNESKRCPNCGAILRGEFDV